MIASPLELTDFEIEKLSAGGTVWRGTSGPVGSEIAVDMKTTDSGKPGAKQRRTLIKVVRSQPPVEGTVPETFTVNITTNGSAETSSLTEAERDATIDVALEIANALSGGVRTVTRQLRGES